jgi:hypothetical protein
MRDLDFFEYSFIAIVLSISFFLFGVVVGYQNESDRFKGEAVVQGVAEYTTDEKGNPVWQWKK